MKIEIINQEWRKILNELNIQIERDGRDKIFCLCPFHNDTNASLVIYTTTNRFKCYSISCHRSGDIITLISLIKFKTEKGKFREVINWLSNVIPKQKLKKYLKLQNKKSNFEEIFLNWIESNNKENVSKYRFLEVCKDNIKDVRLVNKSSWGIITPFVKTFDFVEKTYSEDLLLVEFHGLGHYVFTRKGDMISKLVNKFFDYYVFEEYNGRFMISGKDFRSSKTPEEYKTVSTTFYTENPIIYNIFKEEYNIAIGVISQGGILNFPEDFFIFCFIILDDETTSISKRIRELFKWHLDNKIYWFYKILKIKRKTMKKELKKRFNGLIS